MLRWILAATSLCLTAMPVLAAGSGIVRDLSSTSFRACPKEAMLKEHYFITTFDSSYIEEISIACLRDSASAIWVFKAEEGDDHLASPTEHIGDQNEPYVSPPTVTYESVGYEEGEDCVIDKTLPVWSCKVYRRRPDTPFEVTATGSTHEMEDVDKDAPNLPLGIRRPGASRAAH